MRAHPHYSRISFRTTHTHTYIRTHSTSEDIESYFGDSDKDDERSNADSATVNGRLKDDATDEQIACGLTQWELLADAILATPVTRFIENPPPVNNNGSTEGILEI